MLDEYILKDNKRLRYGYTTGSCATAASMASAMMLLTGEKVTQVDLLTPKGIQLNLDVLDIAISDNSVICCIQKDSGDDPDITNGIKVYSKVSKISQKKIDIDGGIGVGRVTKKGLEQPIGNAAINSTPRRMIEEQLLKISDKYEYNGGFFVEIIIPEGVEIAKKTFNPRLGIEGGISVLGTSGIVEPMSEKALTDSIRVEMKVLVENGVKEIIITPGNYGVNYIKEQMKIKNFDERNIVKCSNYVGETIEFAVELGVKKLIFVGNSGKFVKIAGGIMNTHSSNADSRLEIITAHSAINGATKEIAQKIMSCVTTTEAFDLLDEVGLKEKVFDSITQKIKFYIGNKLQKLDSNIEFEVYMY